MKPVIRPSPRAGMAMMVVLVLSVVILAVGMSMIGLTGTVMQGSVDAKTKIRSRYAAESATSLAIADAVFQAGQTFGGNISVAHQTFASSKDAGAVDVSYGNNLGQEVILQRRSPMNGMRGNKIPLTMESSGKSGAARSRITASVALYQVPIYQFGVFYDGPLEIAPGPGMYVSGRVHTNSNAWFRAVDTLHFQGPVTVAGKIRQWYRFPGGASHLKYRINPSSGVTFEPPGMTTTLALMNPSTQPPPQAGLSNVRYDETRLTLAIGVGTPHSILGVCDQANDPEALKRQKFDCLVQDPKKASAATARFVCTGGAPTQSWIKGPYVFYDRRELKWIKVWDFDVSLIPSSVKDSIFYLDDLTTATEKISGSTTKVIPAFRIVNAAVLPRNMTIACGKPLYVMGDYNTKDAFGNTSNYKNAQLAAEVITWLSSQWPNWKAVGQGTSWPSGVSAANSSMEQPFSNLKWVDNTVCNQCATALNNSRSAPFNQVPTGVLGSSSFPRPNPRINAAIISGNKPTPQACLASTNEGTFDNCYEGGWHNAVRYLEDWTGATLTLRGSFVCIWAGQTDGLRMDSTSGIAVNNSGHYRPGGRNWGYDTRFDNLNNMPPGTPFLATAIVTNWLERN